MDERAWLWENGEAEQIIKDYDEALKKLRHAYASDDWDNIPTYQIEFEKASKRLDEI